MKNDKESKEKVQKSSSSTSAVLDSVDLTLRATTSIEPHILNVNPSESNVAPSNGTSEGLTNKKSSKKPPHVATEILDSILEATTRQVPTTSGQQLLNSLQEERVTNYVSTSQPNMRTPRNDLNVYRSTGGGLINSTSAMHDENVVKTLNTKLSLKRIPPSYSTVLKLGPSCPHYDSRTFPSVPFITRQPPPSYAEVHGGWDDTPSIVSSDSFSLGPHPIYISCPRCRTIVISDIHSERSHLAYVASLILCLCMCWPCCLIPFCIKSCRNTYHFCPTCRYYLGEYRPC